MSSTSPTKRHVSDSSTSSADSAPPPTAVPYPDRGRSKTGVRHQKKKARPAGSEDETVWSSPPPANDEVSRPSPDIASSTSQSIAPPPLSGLPLPLPSTPSSSPRAPPSPLHDGTARKQSQLAHEQLLPVQPPSPQSLETRSTMINQDGLGSPSPTPSTPSSSSRAPPSPPHDGTARKQSQLAHEQLLPVQPPSPQSLETRSTMINQDGLGSPTPSTPSSPSRAPPSQPHDGTARKQIQLVHEQLLPVQAPPPQSETCSTMINQDGLEWKDAALDPDPIWVREPSTEVIESLAREHLSLAPADRCDVVFHAEDGSFHKLFRVIPGGGAGTGYIMRVALPVDPHFLTSSEVATMEYVRSCTTIPIPKIVAHDSSNRNALGFEWILMESVHGTRLEERWTDLTMATKERLVRQLARFQAELFREQQNQIGNIYHDRSSPKPSPTPSPYLISRIVQRDFLWGQNIHQLVPRGPFKDSHTWLSARLELLRIEHERGLETPDSDEGDRKFAAHALSIIQRLLKLLPNVFPPDQPDSTFLFHDDLGMDNILVDEDSVITAVLGWACVSLLPDWRACKMPNLLRGYERREPPTPGMLLYTHYGTINQLYWEEMMDYETTLLRPIFLDEMKRQCPEWVKVMRKSELRRDFETAVTFLNEFGVERIDAWLDSFANGKPGWSLGPKFH
ncbi:MAG: hypothetical protein M1826_005839 [Phylliscum demangeonii]|nr:MAG: hypothetical protein M1826_005839 [Phylliscum demangeonii]